MNIELAIDEIEAMAVKAKVLDEGDRLAPEFVDRCVASAADMALLFVGASQEQMLQHLIVVRKRMTLRLAEPFGAEIAAFVADAFAATVVKCKVEIEKAAVGNSEATQ